MVSPKEKIKEELQEEETKGETEENLEIINNESQKIELVEEASNDELVLPFQRENIKNYLWHLLIIKKVEIRDVVLRNSNEVTQVSYIDGFIIDDENLEKKLIEEITNTQIIPINLVKEINQHRKPVYLFSTSQGVYYSLLRSVVPKLKQGSVIVGIALQQSDYPQPMVVLVHPSKLPELKAQYEALNKSSKR